MKKILVLLSIVLLCGCGNENKNAAIEEYEKVFAEVSELEKRISQSDWDKLTGRELTELYGIGKELYYDYNPMGMTPEQVTACEALKKRVGELRTRIVSRVESVLDGYRFTPYCNADTLFENTTAFPLYLKKGEKLNWRVSGASPLTVRIINADSRSVLKTNAGKSLAHDSLAINNTAIYLVEINPKGTQYIDFNINYEINDMLRLTDGTRVSSKKIGCKKNDFGAMAVPGVKMQKCFEEPRKFTLRGQFKAAFSGNSKALVAVQVPAGATDILYSLRIATSEQDHSSDGEFHDNLNNSYTAIKFLGLPLYSKSTSIGLLSSLLDDNRPLREEDAYCNMYVFRNQKQAKQFQDGTKRAALLGYDVDYSTIGTQSCNGRIPAKGNKTIYLGFENERIRYTNYIWVEVEAVVPTTEYYSMKYSLYDVSEVPDTIPADY